MRQAWWLRWRLGWRLGSGVCAVALGAGLATAFAGAVAAVPARAALAVGRSAAPARAAGRSAAVVSVFPAQRGPTIPRGFIGLSFEYDALPWYAGVGGPVNPVLVRLIRNLDPAGGFVLRVGGDSTDETWWPIPGESAPPGVRISLGPQWLATLAALLNDTGGQALLGVNLKAGRPGVAAAEARHFLQGLEPGQLAGLEIGNEPEQYGSRRSPPPLRHPRRHRRRHRVGRRPAQPAGYRAYLRRFSRWTRVLPPVPLAGPATGSRRWMSRLAGFLAAEPRVRQATVHRYGLSRCVTDPASGRYPTVANLLSAATARRMAGGLRGAAAAAHRAGASLRMDELNSVTCQGQAGVSDSFASGLFMLESMFEAASAGVDAVNVHMWPGAGPNQLFTFAREGGRWVGSVRPAYYGLLMFDQAAPAGSWFVRTRVRVAGSRTRSGARSRSGSRPGPAGVAAWATEGPGGVIRVVLLNRSISRARSVTVRLRCGGRPATVTRLEAPGAYATDGESLGGQSFGFATATGSLTGSPRTETAPASAGGYRVSVPAASAALLSATCG